jgi:hypothetical protein
MANGFAAHPSIICQLIPQIVHTYQHTCQVPPIVVNHEPQVSRDNTIKLLQLIAYLFIKILITEIHDLDGKFATQPA